MKSYQVVEFGKALELREYENPIPKDEEVLIKISACGVCHSDIHLTDGFFDLGKGERITLADRGTELPFTPGHEITGEVVSKGDNAAINIGDKGIVFPWIGCQSCNACDKEQETLCENPQYLGARLNGGYSDYIIVPNAKYIISYGDLEPAQAAPYACSGLTAYSALKKIFKTKNNEFILVIGAGGVGLNGILLASFVHKAKIIAIDIDENKRKEAKKAGAIAAFPPDQLKEIKEFCNGKIVGAIDFVGTQNTSTFAVNIIKKGGTVVVVGLYGGSLSLSLPLIPMRSLNLKGSYVGELSELKELIDIIKNGSVKLINVKTQKLSTVNEAMNDLRNGEVNGRIILQP
jgi:D-arabinose 1-dehydrogenase-like Zn-dependent alcohol dehydrogenase